MLLNCRLKNGVMFELEFFGKTSEDIPINQYKEDMPNVGISFQWKIEFFLLGPLDGLYFHSFGGDIAMAHFISSFNRFDGIQYFKT